MRDRRRMGVSWWALTTGAQGAQLGAGTVTTETVHATWQAPNITNKTGPVRERASAVRQYVEAFIANQHACLLGAPQPWQRSSCEPSVCPCAGGVAPSAEA